ncbi:TolC family protein [Chitinophaga silvatica]|uniref:TolC family protein n=1 Tax=Chitinophaga silvatica TaxID=2282649 RepID=A0A3E1YH50_9BACT|nr:TolC family protein [Chitinophaga silvatica]RFS26697.1 TolC family protein [Chitinophaga silvatica]
MSLRLNIYLFLTSFLIPNAAGRIGGILIIFTCTTAIAQHQDTLTIREAYTLARNNYPLAKQYGLIERTKAYTVSNASKGKIPAFSMSGQATYQSAVTNFNINIPGITLPTFSKDQYKIYGQVTQVIYDGGVINNQRKMAAVDELIQKQNLEVNLYALYDRINQLFFGVLLSDEQLKQNFLLRKDILNGMENVKALLANGEAYQSSLDELKAQLLQADQSRIDLKANRQAFLDMLGVFIDKTVDTTTVLISPPVPELADNFTRPELLFYDFQKKSYDIQDRMLSANLRPKFNFFFQGGYARPGLNFLSNNFTWYYLTGIQLTWNLNSLYSLKGERSLLDIDRKMLDIQKETFLFNSRLNKDQGRITIGKYIDQLQRDDEIVALRENVKITAAAQLENGVLTAHDYITQVIAENQARQDRVLHEIELLQSQYNYQNVMGNINIQ